MEFLWLVLIKKHLTQVLTGAKGIVVSGVDYMTYSAKAKGEAVDLVYPKKRRYSNKCKTNIILKSSKNVEMQKHL